MATLHEVTETTKKLLKAALLIFITLLLAYWAYRGVLITKEYFFPTPPPPPQTLFGKIPPPVFPKSKSTVSHTYVIDTLTGKLPVFLDEDKRERNTIGVYEIVRDELSLLDLQDAVKRAANVGFTQGGIRLRDNIYRFYSRGSLDRTLDIDIVSKNFTLTSYYLTNDRILKAETLPDEPTAVKAAINFLTEMGLFAEDIDINKTKTQLFAIKEGQHVDTTNLKEAQVIRVDFFQKDIAGMPIFYPEAVYSTMNFLLGSGETFTPEIVLGNFLHQKIKIGKATYPLKPIATAYQELLEGKAYIAADYTQEKVVKIKDVVLGYYLGPSPQSYLTPIYVFKGRGDQFFAYVSAIDPTWFALPTPEVTQQNSR